MNHWLFLLVKIPHFDIQDLVHLFLVFDQQQRYPSIATTELVIKLFENDFAKKTLLVYLNHQSEGVFPSKVLQYRSVTDISLGVSLVLVATKFRLAFVEAFHHFRLAFELELHDLILLFKFH